MPLAALFAWSSAGADLSQCMNIPPFYFHFHGIDTVGSARHVWVVICYPTGELRFEGEAVEASTKVSWRLIDSRIRFCSKLRLSCTYTLDAMAAVGSDLRIWCSMQPNVSPCMRMDRGCVVWRLRQARKNTRGKSLEHHHHLVNTVTTPTTQGLIDVDLSIETFT